MIISIFGGRAGDTGKDPVPEFIKSIKIAKRFKNVEILWASVREPYNFTQARQIGCHLITIPPQIIEKIEKFGKSFEKLSQETVVGFLNDSKKLYDLPLTGNISKYNDLNYLTQVSKIFNNANEYERLLLNDAFNKITNGKSGKFIGTLNDQLKKAKLPVIPLSQAGTGVSALNPLKDEALIVGVNNLKNYAEKNINIDPTGSQLNLKELKNEH